MVIKFCTNPQLLHKEEEHIKGILQRCRHPIWAPSRLNIKNNHKYNFTKIHNNTSNNNNTNNNNSNIHMMVPCTKGLSKGFRNISGKMEVQVHIKGGNH